MGNQTGAEGFYEDDKQQSLGIKAQEENKQNGHNGHNNHHPNGQGNNGYNGYNQQQQQQSPINNSHNIQQQDDDDISIYQSQHAMNLYGVTDSGEFVHNAVKRIPKDNKVDKIKELFKYKKKLGEGASGKVLLAEYKGSDPALKGKRVALKELHRKHRVNAQLFLREVVILESLKHENILELYGVYLDRSSYFIATAYYSGGEFFDRIIKIKKFSEKQALKYIKPILKAVNFMHEKAIVHRDLKPSNMVFDKAGKRGILKIIDFGTSEIVIDDDLYNAERVGTILYAPPEWKKDRIGSHIKKGDLWSLGVIVYVLMVGRLPFGEWKHIESYNDDLWFPKKLKKKLSHACINFIMSLLKRDPNKRLSARGALNHEWVSGGVQREMDLGADLKHGLQSVRQDDKISRVIGKVKDGKVGINDLNEEDKKIVYEHVKDENAVKRYLHHYENNTGVGNVNYQKPQHPQMNISMAMNQNNGMHHTQGNQSNGSHVYNASHSQSGMMGPYGMNNGMNQYGMAPHKQQYKAPPPVQLPNYAWKPNGMGMNGINGHQYGVSNSMHSNNNGYGRQPQQQQQQQQQPKPQQPIQMNSNGINPKGKFLPALDKDSRFIMESIHEFMKLENYDPMKNAQTPSAGQWEDDPEDYDDPETEQKDNQQIPNEELDEASYNAKLQATLRQYSEHANPYMIDDDEEMRQMVGDEVYAEIKQQQIMEQQMKMGQNGGNNNNNGHIKHRTHKNLGNPLNIHSEADEEFDFDKKILDSLMDLGLATKEACIRAVLATDSMGVNQAAVWLMDHANDANINSKVDIV